MNFPEWVQIMEAIAGLEVLNLSSKLPKEFVPKCLPGFPQQEHGRANIGAFSFHATQPVVTPAETSARNTFKVF